MRAVWRGVEGGDDRLSGTWQASLLVSRKALAEALATTGAPQVGYRDRAERVGGAGDQVFEKGQSDWVLHQQHILVERTSLSPSPKRYQQENVPMKLGRNVHLQQCRPMLDFDSNVDSDVTLDPQSPHEVPQGDLSLLLQNQRGRQEQRITVSPLVVYRRMTSLNTLGPFLHPCSLCKVQWVNKSNVSSFRSSQQVGVEQNWRLFRVHMATNDLLVGGPIKCLLRCIWVP